MKDSHLRNCSRLEGRNSRPPATNHKLSTRCVKPGRHSTAARVTLDSCLPSALHIHTDASCGFFFSIPNRGWHVFPLNMFILHFVGAVHHVRIEHCVVFGCEQTAQLSLPHENKHRNKIRERNERSTERSSNGKHQVNNPKTLKKKP